MRRPDSQSTRVSQISPINFPHLSNKPGTNLAQSNQIHLARRSLPRRRPRCLERYAGNAAGVSGTWKRLGIQSLLWRRTKIIPSTTEAVASMIQISAREKCSSRQVSYSSYPFFHGIRSSPASKIYTPLSYNTHEKPQPTTSLSLPTEVTATPVPTSTTVFPAPTATQLQILPKQSKPQIKPRFLTTQTRPDQYTKANRPPPPPPYKPRPLPTSQ